MRKVLSIIWYESRQGGHCGRTAQELCGIRKSMQILRARCKMGTTRADGCRRLDEEAWEQCYDVATVAGDEKSVP